MNKNEKLKNEEFMQYVPYGISIIDRNGVLLDENPALRTIMGRSETESLIGTDIVREKKFIDAGLDTFFKQAINERKTITVKNISYVPLYSENEIILNITFTPIADKTGEVKKVLTIIEDITEPSKDTDRVNRADKLSALGFLASGIAVELRNHINKMIMDLNFVKNNIEEHSPAEDYIESLVDELARIKNISDQLLSMSTTDEDEKEVCDFARVINDHPLDVVINRLRKEGFEVIIEAGEGDHSVFATKGQLQQIVGQFLENSEEAMPDKGTIRLHVENLALEDGRYVLLTVHDNGLGISQENINNIFQPFFTTKGKNATGLGLMIVSTIVENLHGAIAVKSTPGEGTSIKVALPFAGQKNKTG